jgi:hypothetical protein
MGPAAPSVSGPAGPTVLTLTLGGTDALRTGGVAHYSATATFSDGTSRAVTPTWASSNTGVGFIDPAGRFEARGHGSANVTASLGGQSASKQVAVINDYGGTWSGEYIVSSCTGKGEFAALCRDSGVGTVRSVALEVRQDSDNLSQVRGDLLLQAWDNLGGMTGGVTSDGRLNLAGSDDFAWGWDFDFYTFEISELEVTLDGPDGLRGGWTLDAVLTVYTNQGSVRTGTLHQRNEIVRMSRTSP